MNKFQKLLTQSNSQIKEQRARIVNDDLVDASEELLRNLKQKKRELERRLMSLSDLNRDSELSLKVVKDDFDAKQWINEVQNVKVALANVEVELEIAMSTHTEWFADDETAGTVS